ncbi:YSIRK-type signal peptide-containing protein [Helcococcus ovis]|uniref:YSIRK-type signal peptide-containing protein n=1 Tax=Helcococcus ovis TaxID=72026 RepID=UPI0038B6DB5C
MKGQNKNRILRYSIRKLSIGVVSVVVGAFTILGVSNIYGADFSRGGVVYAAEESKEDELHKYGLTDEEFNKVKENIINNIYDLDKLRDGWYLEIKSTKNFDNLTKVFLDLINKSDPMLDPHIFIRKFLSGLGYMSDVEVNKIQDELFKFKDNELEFNKRMEIVKYITFSSAKNNRILDSIFDKASQMLLDNSKRYLSASKSNLEKNLHDIKQFKSPEKRIEVTSDIIDSLSKKITLLISEMEKENKVIKELKEKIDKIDDKNQVKRLNNRVDRADSINQLNNEIRKDIDETFNKVESKKLLEKIDEKLDELKDYIDQVRDSYKTSSRFGKEYWDLVPNLNKIYDELEKEKENKIRDSKNSGKSLSVDDLNKFIEKISEKENEIKDKVYKSNKKYQSNNIMNEINKLKYLTAKDRKYYNDVLDSTEDLNHLKTVLEIAKEKDNENKLKVDSDLRDLSEAWNKTDKKGEREQNRKRLLKEAKEKEKAHRQAERERLLKEAKEKEKKAKIKKALEGLSDAWKKEDLEGRKSQLDRIKPVQPEKPSVPWTPLTPATPIKPIIKIKPHLLTEESVKYVKGSMKDIVIKTDAEISSFVEVRVGGKVLDPSNYEVKDGSTMVTLKNSYLEKLPLGKYVIEVVSKETDKYYSAILKTTLTVVEDKVSDDKPQVEKPEVEQPQVEKPEVEKPQVEKPQPQQKPSENNQNPETGDLGVVTSVVTALAAGAALVATRKKDE